MNTEEMTFITGEREKYKSETWNHKWTDEEKAELWRLIFKLKMSQRDAADKMGKSYGGVAYMWGQLKLVNKSAIDKRNARRALYKKKEEEVKMELIQFIHRMPVPAHATRYQHR